MENDNLLVELVRSATALTIEVLRTEKNPSLSSPVGGAVKAAAEFLATLYHAYDPSTALPPTQDDHPPAGPYKEPEMERGNPGMLFIPNEAPGIPDLGPASWRERPFCTLCRKPIYGEVSYTSHDFVKAYPVHAACMVPSTEGKGEVEAKEGEGKAGSVGGKGEG